MARNPFLKNFRRRLKKLAETDLPQLGELTLADLLAWVDNNDAFSPYYSPPTSIYNRRASGMGELPSVRSRSARLCLPPAVLPHGPLSSMVLKRCGQALSCLLEAYGKWGVGAFDPCLVMNAKGLDLLVSPLRDRIAAGHAEPITLRQNLSYGPGSGEREEPVSPARLHSLVSEAFPEVNLPDPALTIPSGYARFLGLLHEYAAQAEESPLDIGGLLDQTVTQEGYEQLVDGLGFWYSDYHPMCAYLDDYRDLADIELEDGFPILLPTIIYDDCSAQSETELAFAEGPASVASRLAVKDEEEGLVKLSEADRALVDDLGWEVLVQRYAASQDANDLTWNLDALANHWESFFGDLFKKYDSQYSRLYTYIASNDYPAFEAESVEDVAFCVEYYHAFWRMICAVPQLDEDYDGGEGPDLAEFVEAVLEASRPRVCDSAPQQEIAHAA